MLTFQGFIVLPLTFRSIIHQKIDFFQMKYKQVSNFITSIWISNGASTIYCKSQPYPVIQQGSCLHLDFPGSRALRQFASRWFIWERQVAEVQDWGTKIRKQRKPFQGCALKLTTAINHFCSILLRNLTKCNLTAWEQKKERFLH